MVDRRTALPFGRQQSPLEMIATFALVAGLLYFGAGIIVPLVLAILLAFALTPLVSWLNRRLPSPTSSPSSFRSSPPSVCWSDWSR